MNRVCSDCGGEISRGSRSGFCRVCAPKHTAARNRHSQPQLPADFAEYAPGKGVKHLEREYRVGSKTIRRWRKEAGVRLYDVAVDGTTQSLIPVPDDFAARVAELRTLKKLSGHYRRDVKTIKRWLGRTGIELESVTVRRSQARHPNGRRPQPQRHTAPAHHRVHNVPGRVVLPGFKGMAIAPLAGREQDAAHHLRRFYPAVYHCTDRGAHDPKGKFWRVGNAVLTPGEMMTRAEAKDWRPDAWQDLAA